MTLISYVHVWRALTVSNFFILINFKQSPRCEHYNVVTHKIKEGAWNQTPHHIKIHINLSLFFMFTPDYVLHSFQRTKLLWDITSLIGFPLEAVEVEWGILTYEVEAVSILNSKWVLKVDQHFASLDPECLPALQSLKGRNRKVLKYTVFGI